LIALGLLVASCGGGAPTTPSATRVAGAWIGNATLTSATGGECVGSTIRTAPRDVFSARMQQSDGEIAASITYQGNRTSCLYAGSFSDPTLDLRLTSCPAARVEGFRCADGSIRDLEVASGRVDAQISGRTGTGSDTTTWHVFASGGSQPIGALTVSAQFRWNMLGIPHDDFHIFDGSILPGYVDGVTIIPEEPNPFCVICGWF
jgi:hypothetical protein